MTEEFDRAALEYHRLPRPGKIEVTPTKALANQRDLALAYSPGVAVPCLEIAADPRAAALYTDRSNLVAVITNGTAVLGLGNIGPLAAKPVMEGKGVLFKKFAGIDVFDIEVNESDPERLVDIIAALEPTFGGINLEDIKAPECFEVERRLRERVRIPVFHDDQHGTAIITAAAILNALRLVGKDISQIRLVTSGAGASAIACLELLVALGLTRANVTVTDRQGVVHAGRTGLDPYKARFAHETGTRTLAEALRGADVFLGLSGPGVVDGAMLLGMAERPIILALANPTPEIMPEAVKAARPDAIIATGRSDYPNQVNNVLCFPYMFRGALDVGATTISLEMEKACVQALADLTMQEASEVVAQAYGGQELRFGPDYLIPKPFDPRLILYLAPAVAKAAMASGVATRPIEDIDAYRERLTQYVYQSVLLMQPIFRRAKRDPKRLVYAEGEEPKILRAVQSVVDERIARPILVARPDVLETRIATLGLRLRPGVDFEVVNPHSDPRYRDYSHAYHEIMGRKGVTPYDARTVVRTQTTVIAALMVRLGDADAMMCGITGQFHEHLRHVTDILGLRPGVRKPATMSAVVLRKGAYFLCDTFVNPDPDAREVAEMALLAAQALKRFGLEPRVALLSHSNFGSSACPQSAKMREALALLREQAPDLEVDGEMRGDAAIIERIRDEALPGARLRGEANLLVMPSADAASIAHGLLNVLAEGVPIGPVLLGVARAAHVLNPAATTRGILNMSALAAVDAQDVG